MISRLSNNIVFIVILLITVAFSLQLVYSIRHFNRVGTSDWADSWEYWDVGRQFCEGNWYPSVMVGNGEPYVVVAPLMPLLVAGSIQLFGNTYWPIIILNSMMSALLSGVLFLLGKEIFSKKLGLLLALISMLNISYYRYNTQILKEPLVYLFVPLIILLLTKYFRSGFKVSYLIWSALAFSVLIHADERYFFYIPFVVLGLVLLQKLGLKRKISHVLMWLSIIFVLMIPWTIRNYKQFGQLVLLSPRTTTITSIFWGKPITEELFPIDANSVKKLPHYEIGVTMGKQYGRPPRLFGRIEKYKMTFLHYWQPTYFKLHYFYEGYKPTKWSLSHNLNSLIFYGVFLPFYLIGLVFIVLQRKYLAYPIGALPLLHSILHTITLYPLERYRYSVNFCVVLIGLWAISVIYKKTFRKRNTIVPDHAM